MLDGTFVCEPADMVYGAISQESVCVIDNNTMIVPDKQTIWAYDGNTFSDIGYPIAKSEDPTAPAWQNYTLAQRQKAFTYYDVDHKRVVITVPSATPTSYNAAEALVFDPLQHCWTHADNLPGGAACYCPHLTPAGIYSTDSEGVTVPFPPDVINLMWSGTLDGTYVIAWEWYDKYRQGVKGSAVAITEASFRCGDEPIGGFDAAVSFDKMKTLTTTLNAAGTGYTAGDYLTILQSGASIGVVQVLTVTTGGVVATISSSTIGIGYSVASALTTSGGTGSGCKVNITVVTPLASTASLYLPNSLAVTWRPAVLRNSQQVQLSLVSNNLANQLGNIAEIDLQLSGYGGGV
jgi:hypothetical protein